jgi:hypothetical protein
MCDTQQRRALLRGAPTNAGCAVRTTQPTNGAGAGAPAGPSPTSALIEVEECRRGRPGSDRALNALHVVLLEGAICRAGAVVGGPVGFMRSSRGG